MKFLHLSDLHIGKIVNGFSMIPEQQSAFRQIIDYIQAERPDAVLIAGDIYDRAVPGIEAVQIFDDFLTALAREGTAVLLIAGNHDSPERLNYLSRMLSGHRMFFYTVFDGTLHKVVLTDEYGEVNFWLLPYLSPAAIYRKADAAKPEVDADGTKMDAAETKMDAAETKENAAETDMAEHRNAPPSDSYEEAVRTALRTACPDTSERNVLLSHQFYTKEGLAAIRSESERNPVGGLDAVDAGLIRDFDYAALGHLHGRQSVGQPHICYSGSPVKYSFSELHHQKSVTMVELGEKGILTIKPLPLTPLHDMREIKGKLADLVSEAVSAPGQREDYLRVVLTDEDELIYPMDQLRSTYPNIMSLDYENARTGPDTDMEPADAAVIQSLSLYDLFSEFFLDTRGMVMNEEQGLLVRELLQTEEEE